MSVIDILTRVDAICKKYDVDKQKDSKVSGDDAFARLYSVVLADIESSEQKAEAASKEKNRASAVAMNAEIQRTKARLLEELPMLHRLAMKRVKGIICCRNDLVLAMPDRIQSIPDGTASSPKKTGGWMASASHSEIKFDSDGRLDSEYFQQSEQSNQFRQEYDMWKMKRASTDICFCSLERELVRLDAENVDVKMELDRQVPLMDEIDTKVDKPASDLKNTNVSLKDTVNRRAEEVNDCSMQPSHL